MSKQIELENPDLKQEINFIGKLEEDDRATMKNQKKKLLSFYNILKASYKMEIQEIINLLNDSSNEVSRFATKNWHVIDSQTAKDKYFQNNSIKFQTESIKAL